MQINVPATDADGNPIPQLDENGEPVLDDAGQPVYEQRATTLGAWLRESVIPDTEAHHQLMDTNNAALADYRAIAEGGITAEELETLRVKAAEGGEYDQVAINVDATDADGNKIPQLDAAGETVLDADGNPLYEQRPTTLGAWIRESVIPDTEGHHQTQAANEAAIAEYSAIADGGITPEELATLREKMADYENVPIINPDTGEETIPGPIPARWHVDKNRTGTCTACPSSTTAAPKS